MTSIKCSQACAASSGVDAIEIERGHRLRADVVSCLFPWVWLVRLACCKNHVRYTSLKFDAPAFANDFENCGSIERITPRCPAGCRRPSPCRPLVIARN